MSRVFLLTPCNSPTVWCSGLSYYLGSHFSINVRWAAPLPIQPHANAMGKNWKIALVWTIPSHCDHLGNDAAEMEHVPLSLFIILSTKWTNTAFLPQFPTNLSQTGYYQFFPILLNWWLNNDMFFICTPLVVRVWVFCCYVYWLSIFSILWTAFS